MGKDPKEMKRTLIIFIISILILTVFIGLLLVCNTDDKGDYKINDIRVYKNTPVWELALAVKGQKKFKIEKIVKKNSHWVNYQEPKYGATLLLWAVGMEKYNSAETLLKCRADPNIAAFDGKTPLFIAAGYSWVDIRVKKDPKYVNILLRYGADPNKNYAGSNISANKYITETGTSPLMNSIGCGIEKTKALVEAGADLNYKTKSGKTAAIAALMRQGLVYYAYYLIVEKKANVTEPFYIPIEPINPNDLRYPVDLLRNWIFDLDSKEYEMKMEIVKEFARQGVDYWKTTIPNSKLDQIKKLYPNNWEEYIIKY